jgi:hypothetical protein
MPKKWLIQATQMLYSPIHFPAEKVNAIMMILPIKRSRRERERERKKKKKIERCVQRGCS